MLKLYSHSVFFSFLSILFLPSEVMGQGESCATAEVITGTGIYYADGPSSGFGLDTNCIGNFNNSYHADWYVYTPSHAGTVIITSCSQHIVTGNQGSNMWGNDDTQLGIMTGQCGALTCVASDDDGGCGLTSLVQINVEAGETYYIQWNNWAGTPEPITWQLVECTNTVTGITYLDQNLNGAHDSIEPYTSVLLQSDQGFMDIYSQGEFAECTDSGTITLTPINGPLYHNVVPPSHTYTINGPNDTIPYLEFAFQPIPGHYDGSADIWGTNGWIGNNTSIHISYSNIGTEPVDGTVTLTLDPAISMVSSNPSPANISGQTASWNVAGMLPGHSETIGITVWTDSTTAPNAPLQSIANFSITQSDEDLSNNADTLNGSALTSYDPNDKQVNITDLLPEQINEETSLEYTVRFQNTGNAPAVNIVIIDSLDPNLNLETFEVVGATHPYSVNIDNGVSTWTFASIFLPDSATDPVGSNGSFQYRITPSTNLGLGEQIFNRADIYFDFNEAVLTNTVVTTVVEITDVEDKIENPNSLQVYPVPANEELVLKWDDLESGQAEILITDAIGRVVTQSTVWNSDRSSGMRLSVGQIPNGIYLLTLNSGKSRISKPIIIQHK